MNGITAWMEKYLVPVAAKIGSQKHLVALRDSFIGGVTIWPALTESMTSLVVSYQLQPYLQVCQTKWVNLQQPLVQVKLV